MIDDMDRSSETIPTVETFVIHPIELDMKPFHIGPEAIRRCRDDGSFFFVGHGLEERRQTNCLVHIRSLERSTQIRNSSSVILRSLPMARLQTLLRMGEGIPFHHNSLVRRDELDNGHDVVMIRISRRS
ncbi:hypothetical protein BLOT_007262 [Blomia tropicalis]|nr:hypothetical protein BLOT_007262 [Blomia tropicalis]